MNKIKLLSIVVGLLVLLNVIVLSFLFLGMNNHPNQGPPNREGTRNSLIEKFGFDENQINLFEISRTKHMELSRSHSKQLEEASIAYYNSSASNEIRDSLYSNVESMTQKTYKANSTHFEDVRNICTPEQLPEMDNFIKGLLN